MNGTWTPNNAAVLVYGLSPQSFYSGAYVDMVRYAGNDYDAPISVRQTITGPLIEQLKQAWTVERAGRGVRRAEALLHREGHPPLEIETNGFTTVTVRRRRE
ncbi:hypothetical protein OV203_07145 [Nannocystis sp. ILAH1]|uniref:hypothetical protein n=1 Tax=unclassified Nannocystis TaxID=2627009 RepID=UPI00226D8EF6|nr:MULTISPECIES: hypothetical protein [unclassified Nannocystis]MCY0986890.1 hypothetical protein [Nannocystis sp. ILAH1]MCY1071771.1 hypothetical protein [Nannocystis sp. RBIL2]